MGEPVIVFRTAFIYLWWTVTKWCSLIAGIIIAVFIKVDGIPEPPQILFTAISGVSAAALLTGMIAYYRIYLSAEGIRGYDVYGFYHLARWESIEAVRPINLLGLKYLHVRLADGHRPLWVPVFLSDVNGFGEAIARLAGPDNPLVRSWPREPCRSSRRPRSEPRPTPAVSNLGEPVKT